MGRGAENRMEQKDEERVGLTVIFTGDGKGKTSAALGVVARCVGHGGRCKMIQFIKGSMKSGEAGLGKTLAPNLEIEQVGRGFTWLADVPREEHIQAAREGLELARAALVSGVYDLVALDEILYALRAGLVEVEQIEGLIEAKPARTHLILTGRGAPQRLIDRADMVTSMTMVKHHSSAGIKAQKCMDF
ncbi:MAG: cob(I)yrinic acid a,c-diamide adenosyltransferase [Nitrospinota bacterium]|nr:cob(I)yrinic acid a,c-diamide adenosyltransferase [Nitrospinota bacterium]